MNVWPVSLPQCMILDGQQGEMPDARLVSDTDAGGGKMRRRLSYMPKPFSGSFRMTRAQLATFETFVETTLQGGTLPFQFPSQGSVGTWIVQIGKTMPSYTRSTGGLWDVQLSLVRLP